MSKITCPECGKSISSFAEACPVCGFPMVDFLEKYNLTDFGKTWICTKCGENECNDYKNPVFYKRRKDITWQESKGVVLIRIL
ncbi:MAG: zinc-ribbon domain-containing protein [Coprococcus comes]